MIVKLKRRNRAIGDVAVGSFMIDGQGYDLMLPEAKSRELHENIVTAMLTGNAVITVPYKHGAYVAERFDA